MKQFYVAHGEQSDGPFDMDKIRNMVEQRLITRETMVWAEGMAGWEPAAAAMPEMFPMGIPPMVPSISQVPTVIAAAPSPTADKSSLDGVVTGFAISGLSIGIIAVVVSIIPCLGAVGIYPAFFGALLSVIGIGIAFVAKKPKALAVAALVVSLIAIGIAMFQIQQVNQTTQGLERAFSGRGR